MANKKNVKATKKATVTKKPAQKVVAKTTAASESSAKRAAETKATTSATAAAAKKEALSAIEFALKAPDAHAVSIAGDFNGWLADRDKMAKGKDGIWRKKIKLTHGRYEYQFVVDGNWWTDPDNPKKTWNPFGTQNSIKEI